MSQCRSGDDRADKAEGLVRDDRYRFESAALGEGNAFRVTDPAPAVRHFGQRLTRMTQALTDRWKLPRQLQASAPLRCGAALVPRTSASCGPRRLPRRPEAWRDDRQPGGASLTRPWSTRSVRRRQTARTMTRSAGRRLRVHAPLRTGRRWRSRLSHASRTSAGRRAPSTATANAGGTSSRAKSRPTSASNAVRNSSTRTVPPRSKARPAPPYPRVRMCQIQRRQSLR